VWTARGAKLIALLYVRTAKSYWTSETGSQTLAAMEFPSKVAGYAARPLLRPRGVGASLLRSSALAPVARRIRGARGRLAPEDGGATGAEKALAALSTPNAGSRGLEVEDLGAGCDHVLALSGELDGDSVTTLEASIARCRLDGISSLTLDLSGLDFIDSAGLWTITQVNRWCEKQGQDFKLVPGSEPVRNIFEVTGLSDVLPFDGENPSERRPPV
jgi:anti-sigma B factor antagonist